jgi:hypothetical protein
MDTGGAFSGLNAGRNKGFAAGRGRGLAGVLGADACT